MTSPKIREIRPNVWSFRVSLGTDSITGKRIQQRITVHGKRTDAQRKCREIEADQLARKHPTSSITLSALRQLWDETTQQQNRRKETTARMELSAYRRYLEPLLGDVPLYRLSGEMITRAYDQLSGRLSSESIRRLHQQLSSMLNWAERRGYVNRAETQKVELPRRRVRIPQAPLEEEVQFLLDSAKSDDDLWLMIRLGSSLGLRRGEIAGLTFGDVNFEKGMLRINKSVVVLTGERPKVVSIKTGESGIAELPIDEILLQELRERRNQFREVALSIGIPLDSIFIFTGKTPGEPRRPDYFTRKMTIHMRKNPHLSAITLKLLRSFTASELAEDGVDLVTAQTVLRHTDHNTTARHYVAPRERSIRRATVRLGQRLGGRNTELTVPNL